MRSSPPPPTPLRTTLPRPRPPPPPGHAATPPQAATPPTRRPPARGGPTIYVAHPLCKHVGCGNRAYIVGPPLAGGLGRGGVVACGWVVSWPAGGWCRGLRRPEVNTSGATSGAWPGAKWGRDLCFFHAFLGFFCLFGLYRLFNAEGRVDDGDVEGAVDGFDLDDAVSVEEPVEAEEAEEAEKSMEEA